MNEVNEKASIITILISIVFVIAIILKISWIVKSKGIINRADKCVNGYIWKSNFKNTMYYQYKNFGKPVKCFILKKNKGGIK